MPRSWAGSFGQELWKLFLQSKETIFLVIAAQIEKGLWKKDSRESVFLAAITTLEFGKKDALWDLGWAEYFSEKHNSLQGYFLENLTFLKPLLEVRICITFESPLKWSDFST